RSVEDRRRGAVILLQLYDFRSREIFLELVDVLHSRATPAVYRLVVVTHGEWNTRLACEQAQPRILDRVRVLELVHQQMPAAPLVAREQVRAIPPDLMRPQQKLREVHQAAAVADFLVAAIER